MKVRQHRRRATPPLLLADAPQHPRLARGCEIDAPTDAKIVDDGEANLPPRPRKVETNMDNNMAKQYMMLVIL